MVAGRDGVEAELVGAPQQAVELDRPVALDARVRRETGGMRCDVVLDDPGVEVMGELEHVVRDVELLGHPARVVDVGDRTTAGVGGSTPEPHGATGHVVTGVAQHRRRDRRVDATTHGDEDPHAARSRNCATAIGMTASA